MSGPRPNTVSKNEVKSQVVDVTLKGLNYRLVSPEEMIIKIQEGELSVSLHAAAAKETLTPEEKAKRLDKWIETCGFATVDWILSKLTPEQRTQWEMSYRFSGIWRSNA